MAFKIKNGMLIKYTEEDGITEVTIPDGVTGIGDYAFNYCTNLTGITIPDSVTSISQCAFSTCLRLKSITIPDSVTSIGDHAFFNCESLADINVSEKNKKFCSCNGILYNKDMTNIIKYPAAKKTAEFIVPDSVISIGKAAFTACSYLKSITISDSVTSISGYAFYDCSGLTSVTISDSVTSIGNSTFFRCKNLTGIKIPGSVTSIGKWAFSDCTNLTSITIPDSIKISDYDIFDYCNNLKIITIYKADVSISIELENFIDFSDTKSCLYMFIFDDVNSRQNYFSELKDCYQSPLALFMVSAYPQESAYYLSHLKNHAEDAVRYLTDTDNIDLLDRFLDFGFVTADNIDSLISYAIDNRKTQSQLVLSDYKNNNIGFQDNDTFNKFLI